MMTFLTCLLNCAYRCIAVKLVTFISRQKFLKVFLAQICDGTHFLTIDIRTVMSELFYIAKLIFKALSRRKSLIILMARRGFVSQPNFFEKLATCTLT